MPLPKGRTNNPFGRKKGSFNKSRKELRLRIAEFVEGNFSKIKQAYDQLEPKEQIRCYLDLLQYSIPKLQNISGEITAPQQLPQIFLNIDPNDKPIGTNPCEPESNTNFFSQS